MTVRTALIPLFGRAIRGAGAPAGPAELAPLDGRPLLLRAVDEALEAGAARIVLISVAGREAAETMAAVTHAPCAWFKCIHATQPERRAEVRNELLLVEWATAAGLILSPMSRAGGEGPPPKTTVGGDIRLPASRRCDVHLARSPFRLGGTGRTHPRSRRRVL